MKEDVALSLLNEKAVFINPEKPFTWTSGIISPIYCDNRLLISSVTAREKIVEAFIEKIKENNLMPQVIAGTATAGIPWASWIADRLHLPLVYVRSEAKSHGRKNAIEGKLKEKDRVLLIEDLISTGKSSLKAADHLKEGKTQLIAVMSLFNYDFPQTQELFKNHELPLFSICTLDDLLSISKSQKTLSNEQIEKVLTWRNQTRF